MKLTPRLMLITWVGGDGKREREREVKERCIIKAHTLKSIRGRKKHSVKTAGPCGG